jgi:transposase
MARKRQLPKEDRQTIITLKSVGLSFKEIAKTAKVSVSTVSYTIKRHLETGGKSNPKPQKNQKTSF